MKAAGWDTASLDKAMLGDPRKALSERLGQVILLMFSPRFHGQQSISMIARR